jgi:hypothetical protein
MDGTTLVIIVAILWTYYYALNAYFLFIVVYYKNRRPTLYLNGVKMKDGATSSRTVIVSARGPIGKTMYGNFHGYMSDFSIYNYTLSEETILQHYQAGKQGVSYTVYNATGVPTSGGIVTLTGKGFGSDPNALQVTIGTNIPCTNITIVE